MSTTTERFGLKIIGPGDSFSDDGFQFTQRDRILIDSIKCYSLADEMINNAVHLLVADEQPLVGSRERRRKLVERKTRRPQPRV